VGAVESDEQARNCQVGRLFWGRGRLLFFVRGQSIPLFTGVSVFFMCVEEFNSKQFPAFIACAEKPSINKKMSEPVTKKRRLSTRPKKNEKELKSLLEKYPVKDGLDCSNCWMVWKKVDRELKEKKKAERALQPSPTLTPPEAIQKLLKEAKRHKNFANTLVNQGKIPQADGLQRLTTEKVESAKQKYGTLTQPEKGSLTEDEVQVLVTGNLDFLAAKTKTDLVHKVQNLEESLVKMCSWVKDEHKGDTQEMLKEVGISCS